MAATCAVMGLNDVFKRADHCWQRLIKAWGGGAGFMRAGESQVCSFGRTPQVVLLKSY